MIRFPMRDRIANLTKEINVTPVRFAESLLGVESRNTVYQIQAQLPGDEGPGVIRRIIEVWLAKTDKDSITWDAFAEALKKAGLRELASELEERIPYEAANRY